MYMQVHIRVIEQDIFFLCVSVSVMCSCNAYVNLLWLSTLHVKLMHMVFIMIIISVIAWSYIHACIQLLIFICPAYIVFLVDPVSVAAVDGTTVEFTCTARDALVIVYFVNKTAASVFQDFKEDMEEQLEGTVRRRNLTITVSPQYNNTEIYCRGIGEDSNVNSETANLTVQGNSHNTECTTQ